MAGDSIPKPERLTSPKRAKARGVKLDRKPTLTPHQQEEAVNRRAAGEPIREIARSYDVHNSTISPDGLDLVSDCNAARIARTR